MGSNRGGKKKPPPYLSARTRKFGPERMFIQTRPAHFPAQFSNTPNARMPPSRCPWSARPINACCPKRLPLVLGVEGAVAARAVGGRAGRRGGRIVICQRHHIRGLPQTAPIPTPPRFLHQRFLHRRALFERSKPFVGAAGPVAVALDT